MGYIEAVFTMSVKMSTIPVKCQLVQETTLNHIRKKSKNCQPKSGKDTLSVTALQRYSSKNDCAKIKSNRYIYIYYNIYKYIGMFGDNDNQFENCNTVTA